MIKISELKEPWPTLITVAIMFGVVLYVVGCPPKVESLQNPDTKVTRGQLAAELAMIMNSAEYKMAQLDEQEQFRDLILQNALLVVEGGTLNPVGLITGALAIYGAGGLTKKTAIAIKHKAKPPA